MPDTISCSAEKILEDPSELGRIAASIAQAEDGNRPEVLIMTFQTPEKGEEAAKRINDLLLERSSLSPYHSWEINDGKPGRLTNAHCWEILYRCVYGNGKIRNEHWRYKEVTPEEKN